MTIEVSTGAPSDPNAKPVSTIQQSVTTAENRPVIVPLADALRLTLAAINRDYPVVGFARACERFLAQLEAKAAASAPGGNAPAA